MLQGGPYAVAGNLLGRVMSTDKEIFTDAINFNLVAQLLIGTGHTSVPKLETILAVIARTKNMQLLKWVEMSHLGSPYIFTNMLAIYMHRM